VWRGWVYALYSKKAIALWQNEVPMPNRVFVTTIIFLIIYKKAVTTKQT